jgi:hypothetical protein
MIDNDEDLRAVRATVDPRTGGPAPSWAAVTAGRTVPTGRRGWAPSRATWTRLAVPAGVAALVLAVAVGGVLAVRADGPGVGPGASAASSPPDPRDPSPPDPAPPGDDATSEQRPNRGPSSPEAVAALEELADAARDVEPARLRPGQLIYSRGVGVTTATSSTPGADGEPEWRDTRLPADERGWYDPEGMIWLPTDEGMRMEPSVEDQRDEVARSGGTIVNPTPAWLAALPTDPDALLAEMRSWTTPDQSWSVDHQVINLLHELHLRADPVLPTDTRVALLRAMARLTGLSATSPTVDGRTVVAIRHAEVNDTIEILFDPATGRAAGRRSIQGPDPGRPPAPGEPEIATYSVLWTWTVVDEVGQTS